MCNLQFLLGPDALTQPVGLFQRPVQLAEACLHIQAVPKLHHIFTSTQRDVMLLLLPESCYLLQEASALLFLSS